ncbi:MAG: glycosyltransferase [Microbacteriaceae bacterium]|nr:glycosyltransferase [Microbacteriaceae bacterium]
MTGLLVHEWIENHGGAEKVLDEMAATFPAASIYCLWDDSKQRYESGRVVESWLAKTPLRRHKALALPLMSPTWRSYWKENGRPEWVLLSSHLFAHHFGSQRRLKDVPKLAYVYTPARYLWAPESDPRGASVGVRLVAPYFRRLDRRRAQQLDEIAAISHFISERISRSWGRESTVIYPPVSVNKIQAVADWRIKLSDEERRVVDALPAEFVFGASRMVPYKRLDVVIDAGSAAGIPVVLAGDGPEASALKVKAQDADVPVLFLGRVSDALMRVLYQLATVYVFAPVEDFGIMPIEAMALGTPVVVNSVGGARETVDILRGGSHTEDFSTSGLQLAIDSARRADMSNAQAVAEQHFGEARFITQLEQWVSNAAVSRRG